MIGVVFFVASFAMVFYSVVVGGVLSHYVNKRYYVKWRNMSTVDNFFGKVGPGARDSFKIMKYIRSNEDDEDVYVKKSKDRIKISIRYASILFTASLISLLSVLIIVYMVRH
jgi:hypothetical protein